MAESHEGATVDETWFLQKLRDDPGNAQVRSDYLAWLEENRDPRAECLRLLIEREELQARLEEIDHEVWRSYRPSNEWLDNLFPLSVRSPLIGNWYQAPSPGARPYVLVGDIVSPDSIVGIVESMKVMNEIKAEMHGVVSAILVEDGQVVEYNQILVKLARRPPPIAGG
jgi:biotin carboxyl carrier protein